MCSITVLYPAFSPSTPPSPTPPQLPLPPPSPPINQTHVPLSPIATWHCAVVVLPSPPLLRLPAHVARSRIRDDAPPDCRFQLMSAASGPGMHDALQIQYRSRRATQKPKRRNRSDIPSPTLRPRAEVLDEAHMGCRKRHRGLKGALHVADHWKPFQSHTLSSRWASEHC